LADNRIGAASVTLPDGRTLIAGGVAADGIPTDTIIIYNPADGGFASAGQLIGARVGHTATLLKDGRVLFAGGAIDGVVTADLEIFNPATATSALIGWMTQPRRGHAAALIPDGTVLIVGGSTLDGVALQSAEIFNPADESIVPAPENMHERRVGASATTLIDGRVLVAGGSDGNTDLASAEIFDPYFQTFMVADTTLSVARSGHTALLLAHNNSVLIAGGSSNGAPETAADLFVPAAFPDPYSYGIGRFAATNAMSAARSGAIGGPAQTDGYAFVAGGGAEHAEVYRFATIKTDKDDYAPGERAVISGSGWQPGELVTLLFQEDPAVHEDYVVTVEADGLGNIYWDQWAPEQHDLDVRFALDRVVLPALCVQ